ncbi:MAG: thiamine pyrophosphate-dependent enzyme, partial [Phycisphaeraceae bacterium]
MFSQSVHAKAIELIKVSIEMTTAAGSGHPTSAASLAHLTTALMYGHMRHDPANPGHRASDRLVLSEGHAVPIVYAAAADLGIRIGKDPANLRPMTREDAMQLRAIDSEVDGHPNPVEGFPFFDAATGSLGQGLSIAAGLAGAARLDGLDKRIFCIIGDGESREGQIWEAMEFIVDHKLSAVCPIFNCNAYAQSDKVSPLQSAAGTVAKLKALGVEVCEIDGHDPDQIREALNNHAQFALEGNAGAFAIVAKTVKGWGAVSMQGHGHHGAPIKKDDFEKTFAELDATGKEHNAEWQEGDLEIQPILTPEPEAHMVTQAPSFSDAMKQFGQEAVL